MENLYFFGLSQQQWDFINGFANWISAIGTVAAVIVSLYLALGATRPKAKLSVGVRVMITPGQKGTDTELVVIRLVNLGDRPIHVTGIGWKVGFWKKRYALQVVSPTPYSQGIPVTLEHGKEAQWHIPTDYQEGWFKYFSNGFLKGLSEREMNTLRIIAYASTGHEFVEKPEKALITALVNAKNSVSDS